jgi:hypothetical protein
MIRHSRLAKLATVTAICLGLIALCDFGSPTRWTSALAADVGLADPSKRDAALQRVWDRKLTRPAGVSSDLECRPFYEMKSSYSRKCGSKMFPLDRRECEKRYREIMELNSCSTEWSWPMRGREIMRNMCTTYSAMIRAACGSGMADADRNDCDLAKNFMKNPENNCSN